MADNGKEMSNSRQARSSVKKPYGPNIVRAWFDTVFRQVLSGLENEQDCLARRNWTFRHNTQTLEYIAPVKAYAGRAWENLEQFLSFFPDVGFLAKEHDRLVATLQEDCRAYSAAIVENACFLDAYEHVKAEARSVLGREFDTYFGAYSSELDFKQILAEYLVNNLGSQPHYYATAELWNQFRDAFVSAADNPTLTLLRGATERAGRNLQSANEELIATMKKIRSELSLQFDVPVVAELSTSSR